MRVNRWKKYPALLLFTSLLCLLAGTASGYRKITGSTGNILTTGRYCVEILEEYEQPGSVSPGQETDKKVEIRNTGSVDSYVRVSLRKAAGVRDRKDQLAEDPALDPDLIELTCNQKYWEWKDGYYYYTEVLKAGETTKEPLLEKFRLSEKAGNEWKGKEARIIVNMESVQAPADLQSIWGYEVPGIKTWEKQEYKGEDAYVLYMGEQGGFLISEEATDLFLSFKDLYPGCARSQQIRIENRSGGEAEIFLRAEAADQKNLTAEDKQRVRTLLEEYAVIEVNGDMGQIYKGPVSGNLKGSGDSMKNDISLGRFGTNGSRTLNVKLSVSEDMGNEFCELTGKVRWIFTAAGEDETHVAKSDVPVTGDRTETGMWIAILTDSACCILVLYFWEKYRRRKENNEIDKRNP